jgi:hypothetical protein
MRILLTAPKTSPTRIARWMISYSTILTIVTLLSFSSSSFNVVNGQSDYDYGRSNNNDYGGAGGGDSSYQDYTDPYVQPDNLYADYAATKMEGGNKGGG